MAETSEKNGTENLMFKCRFCGLAKRENRNIFQDEDFCGKNFLEKINSVYPNILIYSSDPLPKFICENCEIFVHSTYDRLCHYKKTQQKFLNACEDTSFHHRLHEIQALEERIHELRQTDGQKVHPTQLRAYLESGPRKVKSLQLLCIDFFNKHGPDLLNTVLRVDYPPLTEEQLEADERAYEQKVAEFFKALPKSKRGRYVRTTCGIKKRRANEVIVDSPTATDAETPTVKLTDLEIEEKKKLKRKVLEEQAANSEKRVLRTVTGATQRVTYVDDIPDEVLFYGQLHKSKRKKLEERAIMQSIKDAKKDVISFKLDKRATDMKTQVTKLLKTNPGSVVQLNSAISIKLAKPSVQNRPDIPSIDMNLTISTFYEKDLVPAALVNQTYICKYCNYQVNDLKSLSLHNNIHLRLFLRRVGEKKLLPPQLRKGKFVEFNNCRMVRCLNCLRTFANIDFLKQHWILRACTYYCKICYKDFYTRPEALKSHMLSMHGVKTDPNIAIIKFENSLGSKAGNGEVVAAGAAVEEACSSGAFKLKIKTVSSINASSINGLLGVDPMKQDVAAPPLLGHAMQNHQTEPPRAFATKHGYVQQHKPRMHMQWQPRPPFPQMPTPQPMGPQQALPPAMHLNSQVQMFSMYQNHPEFYQMPPRHPPSMSPQGLGGLGIVPEQGGPVQAMPVPPYGGQGQIPVFAPCGLQCYDRDEFLVHRKECKECKFSCIYCVKGFTTGSELQMHLMLSHPKTF